MTLWAFEDRDVTLLVDFEVDEDFVTPTSISYTVRDHDLSVISGLEDVAVTPSGTSPSITVPAVNNAITGNYEWRFVTVTFEYDGQTHVIPLSYGLTPWRPVQVTPDYVRGLLGLTKDELPDRDIDLFRAYAELIDTYGTDIATTSDVLKLNKALGLKAAVTVGPSLQMRARRTAAAGDFSMSRFTSGEFSNIIGELAAAIGPVLQDIQGDSNTDPEIFSVTSPTDVITGA